MHCEIETEPVAVVVEPAGHLVATLPPPPMGPPAQ